MLEISKVEHELTSELNDVLLHAVLADSISAEVELPHVW
jgi:hypothetical protein